MPIGGKRKGAGRKATRPPVERRVMLELSEQEAALLTKLECGTGEPAAAVLRAALCYYAGMML